MTVFWSNARPQIRWNHQTLWDYEQWLLHSWKKEKTKTLQHPGWCSQKPQKNFFPNFFSTIKKKSEEVLSFMQHFVTTFDPKRIFFYRRLSVTSTNLWRKKFCWQKMVIPKAEEMFGRRWERHWSCVSIDFTTWKKTLTSKDEVKKVLKRVLKLFHPCFSDLCIEIEYGARKITVIW